jgi:hypothetical protein
VGSNFGPVYSGSHDWQFLPTGSGLLLYDHAIARASHLTGSLIMLAGSAWGSLLIRRALIDAASA